VKSCGYLKGPSLKLNAQELRFEVYRVRYPEVAAPGGYQRLLALLEGLPLPAGFELRGGPEGLEALAYLPDPGAAAAVRLVGRHQLLLEPAPGAGPPAAGSPLGL